MKNALSALINPLQLKEFHAKYQTHTPFVIHHGPKDLKVLRDLPQVSSLENLLNSWPSLVQAHLPDVRDEASAIDVEARDAGKLFASGMGLLFNDVNKYSPVLQEWVDELRSDLGLSALTYGRSLIYATPDGKGTAPHFDQNINFVLQIHGTKKWTLAKNESVQNPMVRHTIGQPVDPEMMSYMDDEMPVNMPDKTVTFELKPGSLLFVPRGVWHSTEASGHALSLNFTFTAPTWADLFLSALRSRIIQSPEWRATADGVGDSEKQFAAEKTFDQLLKGLINDLPNWQAEDILNATEGD